MSVQKSQCPDQLLKQSQKMLKTEIEITPLSIHRLYNLREQIPLRTLTDYLPMQNIQIPLLLILIKLTNIRILLLRHPQQKIMLITVSQPVLQR